MSDLSTPSRQATDRPWAHWASASLDGPTGRLRIFLGTEPRSYVLTPGVTFAEVAEMLEDVSDHHHLPIRHIELEVVPAAGLTEIAGRKPC